MSTTSMSMSTRSKSNRKSNNRKKNNTKARDNSHDDGNTKWSKDFLKELIQEIGKRVLGISIGDAIRMSAVCRSWRSEASRCLREFQTATKPSEVGSFPWVIESNESPTSTKVTCSLYNPYDNQSYNNLNKFVPFPAPPLDPEDELDIISSSHRQQLPQHHGIQCLGSIEEWLIVVERTWPRQCRNPKLESAKVSTYFFNLMTGDYVMLPPLPLDFTDRWSDDNKILVAASSVPATTSATSSTMELNPNCIVVAKSATGHKLGFCRPTDEKWTFQNPVAQYFFQLVFHEDGKLYAMEYYMGLMVVFDPLEILSANSSSQQEGKGKRLTIIVPHDDDDDDDDDVKWSDPFLLRSSKGEIIVVIKAEPPRPKLEVFKLRFSKGAPSEWVKMGSHDLEDEVIFISDARNMSIPKRKLMSSRCNSPSTEFVQALLAGNCICYPSKQKRIFVHNIADDTKVVEYPPPGRAGVLKKERISVWFTPKPAVKDKDYYNYSHSFQTNSD